MTSHQQILKNFVSAAVAALALGVGEPAEAQQQVLSCVAQGTVGGLVGGRDAVCIAPNGQVLAIGFAESFSSDFRTNIYTAAVNLVGGAQARLEVAGCVSVVDSRADGIFESASGGCAAPFPSTFTISASCSVEFGACTRPSDSL